MATAVALLTPVARPRPATPTPIVVAPPAAFPLAVPFFSQLEYGDRLGWSNCLPAAARSLLGYNGIGFDDDVYHQLADLVRDGIDDGDEHENSYTDYPWLRIVLRDWFGLPTQIIRTWPALLDSLEVRRQPPIILLKNRPLEPRQYPQGPGWDASHFITLNGWDRARDIYHVCDPLAYWHRGPGEYTRTSIEAGVDGVGGVYALAIDIPK